MKLQEAFKKADSRHLQMLQFFLVAATFVSVLGIITATAGEYSIKEARYLLILSVTIACQGWWGFVLFDCLRRRLH